MLDRLILALLALALAGPAGAACVEPAGCEERLTDMAESTQALMSAADAVEERGLLRGVGNIVGASEIHRSHTMRAGLKTGPSTQDRRRS